MKSLPACYLQPVDILSNAFKEHCFPPYCLSHILEWDCTIPGKCLAWDSQCQSSDHMRMHEQTCRDGSQVKQTHIQRGICSPPTHTH